MSAAMSEQEWPEQDCCFKENAAKIEKMVDGAESIGYNKANINFESEVGKMKNFILIKSIVILSAD